MAPSIHSNLKAMPQTSHLNSKSRGERTADALMAWQADRTALSGPLSPAYQQSEFPATLHAVHVTVSSHSSCSYGTVSRTVGRERDVELVGKTSPTTTSLQGYLAHNKLPPPAVARGVPAAAALIGPLSRGDSSSALLLPSLECSDAKVYEP